MPVSDRPPTLFARRVLALLRRVPPGRVVTYGDLARLAGRPGAARAVGNIMREAREPGLPYHRVIAAGGRLGGYGGHEGLKQALLRQEGVPVGGGRVRGFIRYRWLPDTR
jgi:O-6-methylguanine DNA methyltransferase